MDVRTRQGTADLDRAIAAWRRDGQPEEGLSEATRASILRDARRAATRAEKREPFAALFVPLSRLALGAAAPVAALSVILVAALAFQGDVELLDSPAKGHTRVEATKSGDDVVFVIHNGPGFHTVARSTDPGAFGAEPVLRTASGRFRDRLTGDPSIVYYRID